MYNPFIHYALSILCKRCKITHYKYTFHASYILADEDVWRKEITTHNQNRAYGLCCLSIV